MRRPVGKPYINSKSCAYMRDGMIKAIGLLSGGLDSTLAVKLLLDQGIEVTAFNMVTPFCACTRKGCQHEASRVATEFGTPIKVVSGGKIT